MGDQVWSGSSPPDSHSSDFQVALLLKGMSRKKCSPSARCRCFFLGIQPNHLNVDSESGLPQALRSWFVSAGAEKQFFPVVPFRCCDGARRGLKQQA